jgi:hypothetical protein
MGPRKSRCDVHSDIIEGWLCPSLKSLFASYINILFFTKAPNLNVECHGHQNHENKYQNCIGLSLNLKHKTKEPKQEHKD